MRAFSRFLTPVAGQVIGAVFTTQDVDAGDGEILALPPNRAERSSLASFTKSPNLDEHFSSALFLFTDGTAAELHREMEQRPLRPAPDYASKLGPQWESLVRNAARALTLHLTGSLLNGHQPADGFFYAFVAGRTLGPFEFTNLPDESESVTLGRPMVANSVDPVSNPGYQLWTQYRPPHTPPAPPPLASIGDYRIETDIRSDLRLSSVVKMHLSVSRSTRSVSLGLSDRLRIRSALIDGQAVEVMQSNENPDEAPRPIENQELPLLLLITKSELKPGQTYEVELRYEGSVISKTQDGSYLLETVTRGFPTRVRRLQASTSRFTVPRRCAWFQRAKPVSDQIAGDIRTVHRRSLAPERFAGFNLGDYLSASEQRGPYLIECDANQAARISLLVNGNLESNRDSLIHALLNETGTLLEGYGRRWGPLPIHDIVVSPIPGFFGQGFPGLIYLSTVSYISEADRPEELRTPAIDAFFSEMLLPHKRRLTNGGETLSDPPTIGPIG